MDRTLCARNAHCINTSGSYDCQCDRNYEGDGFDHCEPNEYCIEGKCYLI